MSCNRPLVILYAIGLSTYGCQNQTPEIVKQESKAPPKVVNTAGMVYISGGEFEMGSTQGRQDEQPTRRVKLDGFWMDTTEVTNSQFESFVKATSYKTTAEQKPKAEDFPGVPEDKLVPGSLVFTEGKGWEFVQGSDWKHPEGPQSSIANRMSHPVTQVSWDDAMAYAKWAGKELPTEAQFEYAAKSGASENKYAWGNEEPNDKKPQANYWQGQFPEKNANTDKFRTTSPVKSFPANKAGLYDMSGNVWEWCRDWYHPESYSSKETVNPTGSTDSFDPDEPGIKKRVVRGGSFLCAECYCSGYRTAARMKTSPDTGLCHTGFRCVINAPEKP